MSISADGWFDFAIRDPGYPGGVNGGVNPVKGIIPHSAEGDFDSLQHLHDFHWGRATAAPDKRASWGATNLKDGRFVQHYPIYAQTWTSGSGYPNNNFFAFENEGNQYQALTEPQVANIVRVIRGISELQKWEPRRPVNATDRTATLYEHTECKRFGSAATACPSGRIPWQRILSELEEDMAERVWASDTMQTWVIGKNGAAPVLYPAMDEPFLAIYGAHTKAMLAADLEKMRAKG